MAALGVFLPNQVPIPTPPASVEGGPVTITSKVHTYTFDDILVVVFSFVCENRPSHPQDDARCKQTSRVQAPCTQDARSREWLRHENAEVSLSWVLFSLFAGVVATWLLLLAALMKDDRAATVSACHHNDDHRFPAPTAPARISAFLFRKTQQ